MLRGTIFAGLIAVACSATGFASPAAANQTPQSAQQPAAANSQTTPTTQQSQTDSPTATSKSGKDKNNDVFVLGGTADAPKGTLGYVGEPTTVTHVPLPDTKLGDRDKLDLVRALNAEFAFTKKAIPMGEKGLVLPANGTLQPDDTELRHRLAINGTAAAVGARVQITDVEITDKAIRLDLNGGPRHRKKWYQRIEISGSNAGTAPLDDGSDPEHSVGSVVTITFPKYVPAITASDVKALLAPLLDFKIKSPMVAYADTLPPKIRKAVLDHKALVGMNRDMVLAAVGRPNQKFRQTEEGVEYEDWMYGTPPADVNFLRFKGDELVRIESLAQGAAPTFRTAREVDASESAQVAMAEQKQADEAKQEKEAAQRKPPTLRKDGDPPPLIDPNSGEVKVKQKMPFPGQDPNPTPGAPPETVPTTPGGGTDPNPK